MPLFPRESDIKSRMAIASYSLRLYPRSHGILHEAVCCFSTNVYHPSTKPLSPTALMSSYPIATASSSSNFQLIFKNTLIAYEKRTKKDLLSHPLATELRNCDNPSNILALLYQQVQGLDQSLSGDDQWIKWLDPTVSVLFMLSEALGEAISLVKLQNMNLSEICSLIFYSTGVFTCKGDICRSWGPPLGKNPS